MKLSKKEENYLCKHYPQKGKLWCCKKLGRSEGSIRAYASKLGLKQDKRSRFFKDWQERAGQSKVGKKRPGQAFVIKKLWEMGKFKPITTEQAKIWNKDKWKNRPHPRGMLGKHHSEELKEKTRQMAIKMWKNPDSKVNSKEHRQILSDRASKLQNLGIFQNRYSRSKKGTYNINGKKMFFRSLWEVNYALYLDFLIKQKQIKSWEFEVDTFWFEKIKRGVRSYKPDFKIVKNNGDIEYHEIKGWMDAKSKTKIKRMAKYYPKIKLIVIDGDCYKDIKGKMSKMLKFY